MKALNEEAATAQIDRIKSISEPIAGVFKNTFSQIGTTINNVGDLSRSILNGMLQLGIQTAAQMGARWLAQSVAKMAIDKTGAASSVASRAAEAGAGGIASMAAAPFPLNLSAPAFGAEMSALAMSFGALASASGGYDIPAGVNPLTQLHQREMVLPAHIADPLRSVLPTMPALAAAAPSIIASGIASPPMVTRNYASQSSSTIHANNSGGNVTVPMTVQGFGDKGLAKALKKQGREIANQVARVNRARGGRNYG